MFVPTKIFTLLMLAAVLVFAVMTYFWVAFVIPAAICVIYFALGVIFMSSK